MSQRLGDRYELQEQIGGGGMAVVYRAIDTLLNRQVAVKMLRSQFAGDEEFVTRFRREAQSAASLSHPNIVNLYDVGVTPNLDYYIVMEYVDGPTLKDVIRERAPLSVKETLDIARQICDALEHAHDHHIIHRDIKPHNILLTKSGHVKVTDFGIARAATSTTITHHQSQSVLGSVHYFSPEQARGAATDVKSDIYSLGVVMYEMLTGQLPFSGDSPVSVALKHLREKFVEPRQINKSIPQSVENIVLRCLVKSPEARYPNMKAVKDDLRDALLHPNVPKFTVPDDVSDETIAVPVVGGRISDAIPEAEKAKKAKKVNPTPRKRRWLGVLGWTGVAVAAVIIGALAAYYIVMRLVQVPDIAIPDVRNKTVADAVQALENAGVKKSQIQEQQETNAKPKGIVYDQDPEGPTHIKEGRVITLYVSNGPQQMQMPDLSGIPFDQAKQELISMGLSGSNISEQQVQSSTVAVGNVVASTPSAGSAITTNTQVTLQVSQGDMVTVPSVIGMTESDAKQALIAAGLQVGPTSYVSGNGVDGTVLDTTPSKPGAKVPAGTTINLYVIRNNGESGGGASTSNNTTGSGGAPDNTETKSVNVHVRTTPGQSIHVQIYKTDATGTRVPVVDQTIHATQTFSVTLYLAPNTSGEIFVYQNGQLTNDQKISY
ncbi:serine/threonine protein kinase [Alicyclobacillus contaminans]|uniref:Stk1 family PASTA domain-containing Ser/Thr kinase n=1 Tax=Alicyclobacillus contaminans TaxID=392016 RepID=UPI00042864AE|nr:Stk1 family PASTA domain-containing Ser/Thr kinase [Alicyclobacillus contaminans]GMA49110.1 serine/threonine protein kinase [Alicyclobacillus contaminans]